ncbi:MAG: mannose-1-phosphate guanylyltransferase [Spirochaetota bacterium]
MADATIIMAGGSGTRLWPASTPARPKQLLRLGGGSSLIQQAILRAAAATPEGPLVIVTHRDHVAPIAEHVAELSQTHTSLPRRIVYLPEPVGRNTAPAIALGVAFLRRELPPEATALVLTADHVIRPVERFVADAGLASQLAGEGYLVTFGISPTRPETGFGYIESGATLAGGLTVKAFREKPDLATAEEYLRRGTFYWNSGMFAFTLGRFREELAEHEPSIAVPFEQADAAIRVDGRREGARAADPEALRALYESLPAISIDYALMERSARVAVVPASFAWNDVGSWDEAAALSPSPDEATAPQAASVVQVGAENNHVDSDLPVALCGVSDLHVVVKNGKVLVCRRGESQLVKDAVEEASRRGFADFT